MIPKTTFLSVFICVYLSLISSCGTKPTDLRSVVPADALVYLETNDLGKAIGAVTENESFKQLARTQPDLSALNGIKLAVAVTGFETTEEPVTDENSVLSFQPRFVAAAETNAWNWQAVSFAENKIGEFINDIYDGEVELASYPKHDGKYFVWTAQDGRKAYGLVIGSLIFFGNDETAIEKCLAVRRGEADPASKNLKIVSGDFLASGYMSPDGVAQIANIAGIQLALGAGEDEEVKSFIARVLPELIRNSLREVTWTAAKTDAGIEDKYAVTMNPDVATVFRETLLAAPMQKSGFENFVPATAASITQYSLEDPQIAWRSVLLTAQKQTDVVSGNLIAAFSGSLFEPYGVEEPELFLSAVGNRILTARLDAEGDNVVVISTVKDLEKLKKSVAREISFARTAEKIDGADVWKSDDGEVVFASVGDNFILGDADSVLKCLNARVSGQGFTIAEQELSAASVTISNNFDPGAKIVQMFSERKDEKTPLIGRSTTATFFTQSGMRRRTISDFGLIGSIIEQFAAEQ